MSEPAEPRRVVLDTNVWLDLLWFRDPACAALADALRQRRLVALTRDDCRLEWQRVLGYEALAIAPSRRAALLAEHAALATGCDAAPRAVALPRCADPDDQKFLELARDGAAIALISRDRALLALSRRLQRAGLFAVILPAAFEP